MTRFINALNKRRALLKDSDKGFTLIELLVVVIIIGILAAIAIPVYLGIQNNAKESSTQSDVTNGKIAAIAYQTDKGSLPADAAAFTALDPKYGYTRDLVNTPTLTYTITAAKDHFCIQGSSVTGTNFGATDTSGVAKGTCAAGVFTKATP